MGFSLSRHSYMTQIVPSGYRGKAFSRFGGINRIGWFFGPVVGGYTAGNIGLDIPFYNFFCCFIYYINNFYQYRT